MYVKSFLGRLMARRKAQKASNDYWHRQEAYNYAQIFPDRHERQTRFTNEHLLSGMKPSDVVIDLGCADGWHSLVVAPHCARLTGYDFSEKFVQLATEAAQKAGCHHCVFHVADVLTLSLPKGSADVVLLSGLTTCFTSDADALQAMRTAADALKPGGFVLFKDTLHRGEGTRLNVMDTYGAAYRDRKTYGKLASRAGFEILAEGWIDDGEEYGSFMALGRKRGA